MHPFQFFTNFPYHTPFTDSSLPFTDDSALISLRNPDPPLDASNPPIDDYDTKLPPLSTLSNTPLYNQEGSADLSCRQGTILIPLYVLLVHFSHPCQVSYLPFRFL